MQHLSVVEHHANGLGFDEVECACRNDVEHRLGVAHEAADDPQDFGGCGLASVGFVKFSRKLLDFSAELLLHTAGQCQGRHDDAQRFEYSRKSRDHPTAFMPMKRVSIQPYAMALVRTMPVSVPMSALRSPTRAKRRRSMSQPVKVCDGPL
jgi:hypothetical protein